ncbi:type II secretion system protein GspL [Parvularcula maris]|uniref:Type II secretion system protein GspL n=1 Tax=Parvularcula maris TaxID=2965077 RepID=A0A9X2LAL1_9PROT|nr:type II secretion system protein GspL [Parvularcula maris]MCQ8185062.1 type II secretion system protein GspL [Parvularcula maris]
MTLVLVLDRSLERAAAYAFMRAGEPVETGADVPLFSLAELLRDKEELVVLLPGEEAVTRVLALPMKREGEARRAAALLLEDELAAPIETPETAFGPLNEGRRLTTMVPAGLVAEALERLEEAGLDPDIISVDHAALPAAEEGAATLALGRLTAVRLRDSAFTAEDAFARELLTYEEAEAHPAHLSDIEAAGLPNFRKGRFARRTPLPDFKPYLLAASLLLAAGTMFLAGSLVEGFKYQGAANEARQSAISSFEAAYPGRPILDLERQLANVRQSGGPASDFLPLVAALTEVLDGQETTFLTSINYRGDGEVAAELVFASLGDLEQVVGALEDKGVNAREGSDVRRENDALVTRLFLGAPR